MSGAQIAFDNHTVTQIRQKTGQPAPGFEELADAVQQILIQLPQLGLTAEHSEDVTESAKEILTEVGTPSPDRGRIRRGLAALRGLLQPVATQAVLGAGEGAHDLAKAALEHLAPF